MPPYKPWTISPLNPYGAYKPEEYQAETSALRAHVEQRRAEAEAERLAAAQRLREEQIARQWSREMPLEMLQRKQEAEVGAAERQILASQEMSKRQNEKLEFDRMKFRKEQEANELEARLRARPKPEKREQVPPVWTPDRNEMLKYLEKGGKLPDPSYGFALSALGKQDASEEALSPPGMPSVRTRAEGRAQIEDLAADRERRMQPSEESVLQGHKDKKAAADYNRKLLEENKKLFDKKAALARAEVDEMLRKQSGWKGKTDTERAAEVTRLISVVDPYTAMLAHGLGDGLQSLNYDEKLGPQIKAMVRGVFNKIKSSVSSKLGSLSESMTLALKSSVALRLKNEMRIILSYTGLNESQPGTAKVWGRLMGELYSAVGDL